MDVAYEFDGTWNSAVSPRLCSHTIVRLLPPLLLVNTLPTMSLNAIDVRLHCILINSELKVLLNHFLLMVPLEEGHEVIFSFLRVTVPSLRGKDDLKFSLYKPLVTISSCRLTCLTMTQVDLSAPVEMMSRVKDIFPRMPTGSPKDIDAIICVDGKGTFSACY